MTKEPIMIDDVDVYKCKNAKRSIFGIDMECRLGGDCSQNPNCHFKQLKRLENEQEGFAVKYTDLEIALKRKEEECERLKWYLKEIRLEELNSSDIEWSEYETDCLEVEYDNIITLVEEALKERSSEDCRYKYEE